MLDKRIKTERMTALFERPRDVVREEDYEAIETSSAVMPMFKGMSEKWKVGVQVEFKAEDQGTALGFRREL